MRIIALCLLLSSPVLLFAQPCTTTNAGGCGCPDGSDTCALLPDITISWQALRDHSNGPSEYSQSGNGANDGRLRISGVTPNIGWGPFTVRGVDKNGYRWFICGTDTVSIYDPNSTTAFTCPGGEPNPTQIIFQRIYSKNGSTMTYTEVMGGTMTYHPTHGHNHVDDWVTFTLRVQDVSEPDTLKWPIIGSGAKLGFCLEDYGSCNYYNGYCRDIQMIYGGGTVLTSANIPNYGLGGGTYSCSTIEQGISVGYADIYDESLDGMWINIPPTTCNGDYWIVAEVDPKGYFLESNKNNNWTAIPFTLTKQLPVGSAVADITVDGTPFICNGSGVTLQSSTALSYLWSNGETTPSITVTSPGDYFVGINSYCGQAVSDTVNIEEINSAITLLKQDTTCVSGTMELVALGTGEVNWYDVPSGGAPIYTGNNFTTPDLQSSATYYVENLTATPGEITFSEPHDHAGTSLYSGNQYNGSIIFDCLSPFTLKSVKVYTDYPGTRVIEWRDNSGTVLADTSVYIPSGTTRVTLDFNITPGTDYELGTNESANNTNFGYASPALRRSGTGVSYPYVVNGIVSLNDSPFGTAYYYYFYDWEVQEPSSNCVSPRQPVTAVVAQLPAVSIIGLDTLYQITNGPVTMDGQPSGGIFSGDGVTGNTFDPEQAGLGVHVITYSYTDENGCSNEYTQSVHVMSGQLTASAGPDVAICAGSSTTLTATGGTIFAWSTGEITQTIEVSPANTTVYSVTVSDYLGNSDAASVTVTVNPLPAVDFTGLSAEYFVDDAPVTLTGSPVGGTFTGAGMNGDVFEPLTAGVGGPYQITYQYTDGNGCQNSAVKTVTVNQHVGINTTLPSNIKIYPNPAKELLMIDVYGSEESSLTVRMFDAVGKQMMEFSFAVNTSHQLKKIDLSAIPAGIYFLEIVTADKSFMEKVVRK